MRKSLIISTIMLLSQSCSLIRDNFQDEVTWQPFSACLANEKDDFKRESKEQANIDLQSALKVLGFGIAAVILAPQNTILSIGAMIILQGSLNVVYANN